MKDKGVWKDTCQAMGEPVAGICWLFCKTVGPIARAHCPHPLPTPIAHTHCPRPLPTPIARTHCPHSLSVPIACTHCLHPRERGLVKAVAHMVTMSGICPTHRGALHPTLDFLPSFLRFSCLWADGKSPAESSSLRPWLGILLTKPRRSVPVSVSHGS